MLAQASTGLLRPRPSSEDRPDHATDPRAGALLWALDDRLPKPCQIRLSAIEHRPADLVSQPLIIQDKFANCTRELSTLPTALESAGARALAAGSGRPRGFDRVGCSTELVGGDVRDRRRLTGSKGGVASGSTERSGRSHGMATRRAGLRHLNFTPRPGLNLLNRLTGPPIRGLRGLEEVQNMRGTRGCPQSQEPMVGVC